MCDWGGGPNQIVNQAYLSSKQTPPLWGQKGLLGDDRKPKYPATPPPNVERPKHWSSTGNVTAVTDRHTPPLNVEEHPFKDEWKFQRSMSKPYPGNSVAGQPIDPDQPCFTCEVPFKDHDTPPLNVEEALTEKEIEELRQMYARRPGVTESAASNIIRRLLATLAKQQENPDAV
jgi:hypothetical protein